LGKPTIFVWAIFFCHHQFPRYKKHLHWDSNPENFPELWPLFQQYPHRKKHIWSGRRRVLCFQLTETILPGTRTQDTFSEFRQYFLGFMT
jgi:hypothetical protein